MTDLVRDASLFPLIEDPGMQNEQATSRFSFKGLMHQMVPITEWLPAYPWKTAGVKDLAGGLTLGFILVAQSLAHADLCKVSLINGPYSCMLPPLIYALFGTCIHSSVGTGGLISLLTGTQLAGYGDLAQRTHAGGIFTLLVGVIIAGMGVFRLSFLVRFLSRPALSGFITASAILIILSQFKPMLGLGHVEGTIVHIVIFKTAELKNCNIPTTILSVISFLFLYNAKKLSKTKKIGKYLKPVGDFKELIILGVAALFCQKEATRLGIPVVADVPSGLPSLAWPLQTPGDMALAKEMFPGAVLVALVTFLSSFAGAKKFAMKDGYQICALNELLALGFANIGGALCGAVPTQIGLSRMGIAYSAGVKSQLGANVYVAFIVAAVVQMFSKYLYFVPRCVLNSIIVNGASHLTEWDQMLWLWNLITVDRMDVLDFSVWWIACLATLGLGAFEGILVAVAVSLLLIVFQSVNPPIVVLGWRASRQRWMSMNTYEDARERDGVLAFRIEGPLFYANIERMQEWLEDTELQYAAMNRPLQGIVMSAAALPLVDTTAIQALHHLIVSYKKRGVVFLIANASGEPQRLFEEVLVKDHLLPERCLEGNWSVEDCIQHMKEADSRAGKARVGRKKSRPPQSPVIAEELEEGTSKTKMKAIVRASQLMIGSQKIIQIG